MRAPEHGRRRPGRSLLMAIAQAMMVASAAGCASLTAVSYDDSPAGAVERHTAHSFFWGAVRGNVPYGTCGVDEKRHGNGLWQASFSMSTWDILASVLTLGVWTPIDVGVECAADRPGHIGIGGPACDDASARPAGSSACAPTTAETSEDPSHATSDAALALSPSASAKAAGSTATSDPSSLPECEPDLTWHNVSNEVTAKPKWFCRPKPGHGRTVDRRAAPIVELVRRAEGEHQRIRAVGAGWSFSRAAASDGYMVDMRWFAASLPLPRAGDWAPGTAGRFFGHFEAGASVDAINLALQQKGYSLLTMGGSAGQTWIGAAATGTHGGDTGYRAIADYVQALAVVTEGGRLLWIERSSTPLTRGGYAARIGAKFIQDDEIFNAAVVGLGSFGIVVSAVIEVQPLESYMLWRQSFPYDAKLEHVMSTFDFSGWEWPDQEQEAFARKHPWHPRSDSKSALRHFEVVVNPYATGPGNTSGAIVTSVWSDSNFVAPPPASGSSSNLDTKLGTKFVSGVEKSCLRGDVPSVLGALLPSEYPLINVPIDGPLRLLFPRGNPAPGVSPLSMEIALARENVVQAMRVILAEVNAHPGDYYYPGLVALRFSEGTNALLGFSNFKNTVTIEFPTASHVAGTPQFFTRVHQALDRAGIPHTQHLGQWNTYWDEPKGMLAFGDRLGRFHKALDAVLPNHAGCLFANDYTERIGVTSCGGR